MKQSNSILATIARTFLHFPTLDGRRSDDCGIYNAAIGSQTRLLIPKGTALEPGKMYLRLYHGRTDPDQNMDEWGFDGPTFGPLSCYVHTYCCTFRIHGESDNSEIWLEKHADMIQWDGCFYGDMEVFIAGEKTQPVNGGHE